MNLSHAALVKVAAKWLRTRAKCQVIATEVVSGSSREIPDAIGWRLGGQHSIMIECKRTRGDFVADLRKGLDCADRTGLQKYYMTPPGMLSPEECPDGWGLLETDGGTVVEIVPAPARTRNRRNEIGILYSLLLRQKGKSPKLGNATLALFPDAPANNPPTDANPTDAPAPDWNPARESNG
jgi:hypothetical protein